MIKRIFLFSFFITAVHPSFASSNASLDKSLRNLVERTTYGSSFEDITIAKEKGYSAYLDYILNPNEINDSEFEAKYLDKSSPNYTDPYVPTLLESPIFLSSKYFSNEYKSLGTSTHGFQ